MNKRTKLAVLIGAIAAVVSAVVLIIVFWDRILEKLPCGKCCEEEDFPEDTEEDEIVAYTEEETADFADLTTGEE